MGLSLLSWKKIEPTFGGNLGVGSYFFLSLSEMYDKRAMTKVAKSIVIVIAMFSF